MFQVQFLVAASLAITFLTQDGVHSLLNPQTQEVQESSNPAPKDKIQEERIEAEVAEIMAIRKQLGGGVSEQLKGFSIEMPAGKNGNGSTASAGSKPMTVDETFKEQLSKQSRNTQQQQKKDSMALLQHIRLMNRLNGVSSGKQKPTAADAAAPTAADAASNITAGNSTINTSGDFANERKLKVENSGLPPQKRRETVRHAARILEEAAAILEEASEYEHADKVRQTARELWRTAR